MKRYKFTLLTHAKFHYFEVAKSLIKKNQLIKLVSGYPKFKIKKLGIPYHLIDFFGLYTIINYLLRNIDINFVQSIRIYFQKLNARKISQKSKQYIKNSDVILGLSGTFINSIKELKKYKKIIICERSSSHILFQKKIIEEEYTRYNLLKTRDRILKYEFASWKIDNELIEYSYADHILTPSKFVTDSFKEYGINSIIEIPFGANTNDFFRDSSIKKKENEFHILFVGQITLRKGLQYLINAFNQFKHPNAYLHIVGGDTYGDINFMKKLSASNKKIVFHGIKKGKDLLYFYNVADIYVLPSIEEGFAITQLEALSCGCPILISENTGAKETVIENNCGMVFPIRDSNQILKKLEILANDKKLLKNYSDNALKLTTHKTWDTYTDILNQKLNKIYE